MNEYKTIFECVRPDFICNLHAERLEDQCILKVTLQCENQNILLYGFEGLADSVSDLLSAERIVISEELNTCREFGTIRIECWVDEVYSEHWCDRANTE